ncbi:MAG: hypothetical protein SFU91_15250 [Chloroherpetonaceae bacterium]|nr:hypothetical protein [Chloroherpetonaceae bacterium]
MSFRAQREILDFVHIRDFSLRAASFEMTARRGSLSLSRCRPSRHGGFDKLNHLNFRMLDSGQAGMTSGGCITLPS